MKEKIVFVGTQVGYRFKIAFENQYGCFQSFDPRPEPENIVSNDILMSLAFLSPEPSLWTLALI